MVSDAPSSQTRDLSWLLRNLIRQVPATRGALLLSSDGIAKFSDGLEHADVERLAALTSGLYSLSRGLATRFCRSDGVRQVMVELDDVSFFATAAGRGSVLAVLTDREVDAGILGYEMSQLVKRVPTYLATPQRPSPAPPGEVAG